MNTHRLLIAATVVNSLLLACTFVRSGKVAADGSAPVLRGRGLEIVDDSGRVRASISLLPADPDVKMPDGRIGYPETVLLRLINSQGRPNVKMAATENGSGLLISGETDPTFVQILAEGSKPMVRLSDHNGQVREITP